PRGRPAAAAERAGGPRPPVPPPLPAGLPPARVSVPPDQPPPARRRRADAGRPARRGRRGLGRRHDGPRPRLLPPLRLPHHRSMTTQRALSSSSQRPPLSSNRLSRSSVMKSSDSYSRSSTIATARSPSRNVRRPRLPTLTTTPLGLR